MGIKFFCPNGHKLNVKTFLGGKKAICPKCGVKVIVPLQSAANVAGVDAPAGDDEDDDDSPGLSANAAAASAAQQGGSQAQGQASPGDGNRIASAATEAKDMNDPIDEAPNAVWYVRPPSGGQFGPAAGPTMRSWIQKAA